MSNVAILRVRGWWFLAVCGLLWSAGGCARLMANQTASFLVKASPSAYEMWDYDFAQQAVPAGLVQLEAILSLTPNNQKLLKELAIGYTGYAYSWLEDDVETADPFDFEEISRLQRRAKWMYLRGRQMAFRLIRLRTKGFDGARAGGLEAFEAWLDKRCRKPGDAPMLLWAGNAWGSAIAMSLDDPEMLADLGYVVAMVERSMELDRDYFQAGAMTFLAAVKASYPPSIGGDPEGAKVLFEEAMERTGRAYFPIQLNYARTYALVNGKRELYESLLREILDAGDVNPAMRLPNKVAKHRARRYLAESDDLFL